METEDMGGVQEFNSLYKELDDIYHEIALQIGVSDCILTILYTICRMGGCCRQRDVCERSYVSKTTVSSAIRKLEREGFLYLEPGKGRDKYICLTEKGKAFSAAYVCPLLQAEDEAFSALEEREQKQFLKLVGNYVANFRKQKEEKYKEL